MNTPVKALLINTYPLWADACARALAAFPRPIQLTGLTINIEANTLLENALPLDFDIILVALELPLLCLATSSAVRALDFAGPILVVSPQHAVFTNARIADAGAQAALSADANLDALAALVYRLVDQTSAYQPARAPGFNNAQWRPILNSREKDVLQLLADDLTDQEIATRLGISKRTVSNHLHHLYAKLGVKGRAGALGRALQQGLITLNFS